MKQRSCLDRYATNLGALLVVVYVLLLMVRHKWGLADCVYCRIQSGLLFVVGVSFVSFSCIKKTCCRICLKWIALIASCAGIGAAWGHLSILYHAHLLSFGNLLMRISRMDVVQQGLMRRDLEAYFSINGIWTCLPFWSLLMFCGLFAFSAWHLQRRKHLS